MNVTPVPKVLMIMICIRCALGGAEKRYARVFEMLVAERGCRHKLLINRSLLNLLQAAGILTQQNEHLIVLDPPSARYRWLATLRGLAPLIDAFWYIWQCWRAMCSVCPQLVHPLLTGVYLSLPALLLHPHIRPVMSAYSYQFENYRDRRLFGISLGAAVKRFAMQRSVVIEALSTSIRDDLVVRGLDPQRIVVAPGSFTDLSLCQPAPGKHKWIVFAGRFVEIKNPLLLAQALPAVVERHPDVHVWFLGEGPLEAELRHLVAAQNLADYVTIQFDPQPTRILNQSAIFVSLQSAENYPSQSLLEAMACANAIVATDAGETWRLVDETTGVRVALSVEAVTQGLLTLLDDPNLAQRQGAARKRIITDHTTERFFEYMTTTYRSAGHSSSSVKLSTL